MDRSVVVASSLFKTLWSVSLCAFVCMTQKLRGIPITAVSWCHPALLADKRQDGVNRQEDRSGCDVRSVCVCVCARAKLFFSSIPGTQIYTFISLADDSSGRPNNSDPPTTGPSGTERRDKHILSIIRVWKFHLGDQLRTVRLGHVIRWLKR